jgi:glucose/arabinose dehydrogenase
MTTPATAADELPLGFSDELVASVPAATALAFTPDGRLLVTSKPGALRVVTAGGVLLATPAIDLSAKLCANSERGLLGVAVDPAFGSNHFIYLYYTARKLGACPMQQANGPVNRVSRFVLPASNVIASTSELVLIDNILSYAGNHNAGDLRFGKDDKLYVSVGDGGCDFAGAHLCGSQNDAARDRHTLLGKILRVNRDGTTPADNPFTGALSARCGVTGSTTAGTTCRETFAMGLRNPYRFAMDPNASGTRFYINDVGQNQWEEIDLATAGADYGWNVREGHCATDSATNCGPPPPGMTNPIFDYNQTTGCASVTGGAFVPANSGWPASYIGSYLFSDYVCGKIFRLEASGPGFAMTDFATGVGPGAAVHLEFGPGATRRALYYATFTGQVRRITYSPVPVADLAASPTSGPAPLNVSFDGSGSADPEGGALTYLWAFGDGATATTTVPTIAHVYTSNGLYDAVLVVRDPTGLESAPDTASIVVGNSPPTPSIASPAENAMFSVGQSITLSGIATDLQDGTLPPSSLTWTVLRFHQDHTHPWFGPVTGNDLTFTAPPPEDLAAVTNSHLIVQLTATDSQGAASTVTRVVQPRTVTLTFRTNPTGLNVKVAGVTKKATAFVTSWVGWMIQIEAPSPQNGHVFVSWSDGGMRVHTITTPATATTYTARYVKLT